MTLNWLNTRRLLEPIGHAPPAEFEDDRAGALGFGLGPEPPVPKREFNKTLDLEKLLGLTDAIIADEESPQGPTAHSSTLDFAFPLKG
jgi:hypothetical protein